MKKTLFPGLIALAALTMTSCSNDENMLSIPQDNAIEFGTYIGRDAQSRGTIVNNAFEQFGVTAFYTGKTAWSADYTEAPNFMYNQAVNKSGSDWSYSPIKYWPTRQGDQITFFAYAPMASNSNGIAITGNQEPGTPKVTYTIDFENLENMGDFVADALIDQKRQTGTETLDDADENVVFALNHELTRVNIQAKLSADAFSAEGNTANKTKVNITDIKFTGSGFAKSGEYTFANMNDNPEGSINRGNWKINAEGSDNSFSIFDINNENNGTFVNWANAEGLGNYTKKGVSVPDTKKVDLFVNGHYLFLIPANGVFGIANGTEVSMHVSYDIVTHDNNLSGTYSITSAVKEIGLPTGLLKQGVAYNILLTFGMNEITLSADVAEWGNINNEGDANVDWPKNDK